MLLQSKKKKIKKSFNKFLALRKQSAGEDIILEIKNIIEETNIGNVNYYELNKELNEFGNGRNHYDRRNTKKAIQQSCSTNNKSRRRVSKKLRFLSR